MCHCTRVQDRHTDVMINEFKRLFPSAYDHWTLGQMPPSAKVMSFLAELRRELQSDEWSTADEGAAHPGAWFWPPCRSASAIQLEISATGSRWRHQVGGPLKIASILRRNAGKEW